MTNCKNCGGTYDGYSCMYCGTLYKVMPVIYQPEKISTWQRLSNWFKGLLKKEKNAETKYPVKNVTLNTNTKVAIALVAGIAVIGAVAIMIAYRNKKKNDEQLSNIH